MQHLFLASSGLGYLETFIQKKPSEMHLLFIPTAGNLDTDIWWIDKDREVLATMGFLVTELDIATASQDDMSKAINQTDIVYVAGGNTFYLLEQLRKSGFDKIVTDFVNDGGLYAGASAGALVAGADIGPIDTIDEADKVPELQSTKGLGFVDIIPVPHYDMLSRTGAIDEIIRKYGDQHKIVTMTDDEAIVVHGNTWEKISSKRNTRELDWAKRAQEVES